MKPAFWMAVLILALMVGGISFVSVYLSSSSRDPEQTPVSLPSLNFPIKTIPREGEKVLTTEIHQGGRQDYWFVNDSDQELAVGLNSKGCTCTDVELTVAPPDWMPTLARSAVLGALQLPPRGLANLTTLAAATLDRSHLFPELSNSEMTMLTRVFSTTVPPRAVGRVRLTWRQEVAKPLKTYADLWMGQRGGSVNVRLEAGVLIASPLEATKDVSIPVLSERELEKMEKSKPAWIVCFSLTRPTFPLKAELLYNRFKPESDPIEVGEPIPLTAKDLRRIEQNDEKMHRLTALSGYRIPVRVRAKAKNGTPMEWGRFHRVVQLSSTDADFEPVQVQISGEVLGDISLGGGVEDGTINLGPFQHTSGVKRSIVLQTDDKTIDLELDTKHKPKYLNATLSAPQETAAGHRSWLLKIEVPPGAAQGGFPRSDDPDYRDSAIYVKTRKGKSDASLRSVRIPVRGEAN